MIKKFRITSFKQARIAVTALYLVSLSWIFVYVPWNRVVLTRAGGTKTDAGYNFLWSPTPYYDNVHVDVMRTIFAALATTALWGFLIFILKQFENGKSISQQQKLSEK